MLQEVLERKKTGMTVLKFMSEPLPKSYTCKLFRIYVYYLTHLDKQSSSISLIAKRKDENVTFATDLGMIGKELMMYRYGLPKLEMILKEKLSPSIYLATDKIIVMDDLNMDGYKNTNNGKLLNYNHCVNGIKALAKFHAASVGLHQTDASLVEKLGEELFYKDELYEKFHIIIENSLQSLSEEVATWSESKHYEQSILNIKNRIWKLLVSIVKQNKFLCVLNHGDFTLNNLLFKYGPNGEICDVKIIDFQCCRYSSPVIDLQFFLSTSVDIRVIENHLPNLLELYLNTFNNILLMLNCPKTLSKTDFELEFNKADFIGLYATSMTLPQNLIDEEQSKNLKGVDFEEFKNAKTNPISSLMKSHKYREIMPKVLDYFYKRGLFME